MMRKNKLKNPHEIKTTLLHILTLGHNNKGVEKCEESYRMGNNNSFCIW